jgi:dethiobiotin synthetase
VHGLFVTGTDTGVGKTVLSAALLAAMAAEGCAVSAHKPAVTGLEEHGEAGAQSLWPPDHELLAAAARMDPERVAPLRYGPAVSPQLAAELAGERIDREQVIAAAAAAIDNGSCSGNSNSNGNGDSKGNGDSNGNSNGNGGAVQGLLIVEGVGGLFSPLAEDFTVCHLAAALRLPLLIAARPGLGTINHTLLTLQAARAAGLTVRAVVLTPWPEQPSRLERSNLEAITRLGFIEVATLAHADGPELEELARVGARLPWRRWLGERASAPAMA